MTKIVLLHLCGIYNLAFSHTLKVINRINSEKENESAILK